MRPPAKQEQRKESHRSAIEPKCEHAHHGPIKITHELQAEWECSACGTPCKIKMTREMITAGCSHVFFPQDLFTSAGIPYCQLGIEAASVEGGLVTRTIAPAPAPAPPLGEDTIADCGLMIEQLRELEVETQGDEVVALRHQLEEYKEEIERSKKKNGANWFVPLPEGIRSTLIRARDAMNFFIAISEPRK